LFVFQNLFLARGEALNPKVSILDTQSGRYMVWSSPDVLGGMLLREGIHEGDVITLSEFILRNEKNKFAMDIGANIGSYTIPLATRLGEEYKFYCFEIQRHVFYQLCGNVFLNSLTNVYPFNFGIGDKDEKINIQLVDYSTCWNVGGYSMDEVATSRARGDFPSQAVIGETEAEIKSIDNLPSLDFAGLVKLDVEGHELEVLKGMVSYLKRSGYPPVIFEAWGWDWYAEKKLRTEAFLREMGYSNICLIAHPSSVDNNGGNYLAQHSESSSKRYALVANASGGYYVAVS